MRTKTIIAAGGIVFPLLFLMLFASTSWAQTSDKSILNIDEQRFHRRAVEVAFWGMPVVNYWAMREGFERDADAGRNAVTYFSQPMDWQLQVTTPNNTTLYIFSFWNTGIDGPIVVEVPPTTENVGLFGTAMDAWQRPLVDMGGEGHDRGLGAKYLFLPPGYQDAPPVGYVPIPSPTNNGWFLLRTLLPNFSDESLANGEAFIEGFKVYPLSEADNPPDTKLVDGSGVDIDGIAPYDYRFYVGLNDVVQEEFVAEQDMVAMEMLRTIGIEKGNPFTPDTEQQEALSRAAKSAQAEFKELIVNNPDRYWEEKKWSYLVVPEIVQETDFSFKYPRLLDYTTRGVTYYSAFSSVVTYGTQTQYLVGGQDSDGQALDGGANYTLNVPVDVPARQFWSVLVYDMDTAGFVKNTPKAGVSSLDTGLEVNTDGSVDVYFGPKPPSGKEGNWAPTVKDHDYFLLFRFYGPTQPLLDKSWSLNDLEKD